MSTFASTEDNQRHLDSQKQSFETKLSLKTNEFQKIDYVSSVNDIYGGNNFMHRG